MVGFLASALRAPAPKPTKCDTVSNAYLFSVKWFTSIDITDENQRNAKIHLDILSARYYNNKVLIGVWRSLVSRLVRVQEAVGSNPATPTMSSVHTGFEL